jgi:hypothetical protein
MKLDSAILGSSIASQNGDLLAHYVKKAHANKVGLDKEGERYLGSWISVIVSVSKQSDKYLSNTDYIKIGRKKYNGLLIPIDKLGIIVRLSLEKEIESEYMSRKVRAHVQSLKLR